jgi:hypothetical protein
MLLKLIELPRCTKSKTLSELPIRVIPYALKVLPSRA